MSWKDQFPKENRYFETDSGVLYLGDCLEVMKGFPEKTFDAIVTDPPYGIGFNYKIKKDVAKDPISYWEWLSPIYKCMINLLKDGGFFAIWQTQLYMKHFWDWFGDHIHIYAACKNFVQIKKNVSIGYGWDPIVMFYKKGSASLRPVEQKRSHDFYVANTAYWVTRTEAPEKQHPCPRPIDQVEQIIDNFIIELGMVLDPFLGSGTTAVACEKLNRRWIGIEIEKKYCDICVERLRKIEKYLI